MTSRVIVALRVKATPERAFAVFTGDIGRWWRPNPIFPFTRGEPGHLSFEPGPNGRLIETLPSGAIHEVGKVLEWSPPLGLTFGWRQSTFKPDQQTEVEIRFEPVGDETRVTVEHRGWDTIPAPHVARHGFPNSVFLQRHAEWWRALLSSLEGSIAQGSQGGPLS